MFDKFTDPNRNFGKNDFMKSNKIQNIVFLELESFRRFIQRNLSTVENYLVEIDSLVSYLFRDFTERIRLKMREYFNEKR